MSICESDHTAVCISSGQPGSTVQPSLEPWRDSLLALANNQSVLLSVLRQQARMQLLWDSDSHGQTAERRAFPQ